MDTAVAETVTESAPEAPLAEGKPTEPRVPLTSSERRAKLIARLRGASSAANPPSNMASDESSAGAGSTDEASTSLRSADVEASEVPDGDEAADAPREEHARPPRDEEKDLELKLSRMSRELRDAKADMLEAREKVQAHDQLVSKIMRGRQDPHALVAMLPDLFGRDFGQIADWIVENEQHFRDRQRYAELPPDVREELEASRRERMERKQREARETEERTHNERVESYKTSAQRFITDNKADYPLAAAVDWSAQHIALAAIKRGTRDARPLLDELENNLRSELSAMLGKPELLRALLKSDTKLADSVRQAFFSSDTNKQPNKSSAAASLRSGPSASADGPRSLHNGVTASDVTGSYDARSARRTRIMEALKAHVHGR